MGELARTPTKAEYAEIAALFRRVVWSFDENHDVSEFDVIWGQLTDHQKYFLVGTMAMTFDSIAEGQSALFTSLGEPTTREEMLETVCVLVESGVDVL